MNTLPSAAHRSGTLLPRWADVATVLLDMDGTLLDLRFDNYFWLELVPQRYAQLHQLSLEAAYAALEPRFIAKQGTLDWYCIDFWSRELALDVAQLKREVRAHVRFLPGAELFLQTLHARGLDPVLVTNAHRETLAIKIEQTGLGRYFRRVVSSHELGMPKEDPRFWAQLQARLDFDPARCLFVDDSIPVLRAARVHGIAQIFAISRPDSTQRARQMEDFATVERVQDLLG
ncbi:MAG TPA: GMP/IMP nucleotidase [Steroidobacteraceae bacterium]|nr:GMP/IMP nucleotidase [Steroidobacteraceae bacterium]